MKKLLLFLLSLSLCNMISFSQKIPSTKAWNPEKLAKVKANINDAKYLAAYKKLLKEAESQLTKGPYTVMDKTKTPPSGDKHDYWSMSPYWWPNPDTKDGLPYIRKDGMRNPELKDYDSPSKSAMLKGVTTLSLAYYFSGEQKYAEKAVQLLDVWFLDPKTKMNPNLNFGQFIPGKKAGRGVGLIDTYGYIFLVDAIAILNDSGNLTKEQYIGLKKWFSDFTEWMWTSPIAQEEYEAKNNHGLAYDVQITALSLFTDRKDIYTKIISEFPERRLFAQIEPDGSQPLELTRTLAYHYSKFNITHMLDMAELGQRIGLDILNVKSNDGRCIKKALDFVTAYVGKESEWKWKQIRDWDKTEKDVCMLLRRMSALGAGMQYEKNRLELNKNNNNEREILLYSLE